ncbi:MAG: glycosyltransferase family 2 protein [Blastocatellales bacterium]
MLINIILTVALILFVIALLNAVFWPKPGRASQCYSNEVSVLIPARNEEANLPACLDSVLMQGDPVREVLIYNDHSIDGTAEVIAEFARRDDRVGSVQVWPLEPGWCGKNFACWQLAKSANGKWLLFIDADARLADGAVARMVEEMNQRQLQLLSCWPGLELLGFWERTLMPMLNFVVFATFPSPLSLRLDNPSLGLAHGACLMFDRKSYEEIGGHSAVRDQIFEDTRLAQLWRERGRRGLCLDGQEVVRVRMYSSFDEIWLGFQKNFFPAFKHEATFWSFLAFHLTIFLLPFIWAIYQPGFRIALAALIVLLIRLVLCLRFRQPVWAVLLHPIAEAILIALGFSSWRRCKTGQGVAWKGREYHKLP